MPELFALDPDTTFEYTPEICRDLPEERRPVFVLRSCLKPSEEARVLNQLSDDSVSIEGDGAKVRVKLGFMGAQACSNLRILLKGWRNFRKADGTEASLIIDPADGYASAASVDLIPREVISELVRAALERGSVGGLSLEKKDS